MLENAKGTFSFSGTAGSPKKKPSVLSTSSREGAKVLGWGRLVEGADMMREVLLLRGCGLC